MNQNIVNWIIQGGKKFGAMKKEQEQSLDEINKVIKTMLSCNLAYFNGNSLVHLSNVELRDLFPGELMTRSLL